MTKFKKAKYIKVETYQTNAARVNIYPGVVSKNAKKQLRAPFFGGFMSFKLHQIKHVYSDFAFMI